MYTYFNDICSSIKISAIFGDMASTICDNNCVYVDYFKCGWSYIVIFTYYFGLISIMIYFLLTKTPRENYKKLCVDYESWC